MPILDTKMVSPSHLLSMFFIYKVIRFTLQKISSPLKKDVQVPSLNHSALTSSKNVQVPSLNLSALASSSQSCKYDVFLSFRGEDTRKTFVDHFYSALVDRQIQTYKDDETLPRGESIRPCLFKAIEESRIAIIIFSKNYAESSWCLEELAYIMKCREERGLLVMPIYYDVDPSEVRKQKGYFGKAFAKQELENTTKAESWKKTLVDVSNIGGWDPKNIANGHESKVIKEIVDTILDRLLPYNSDVDDDLVGMATRLQDLRSRLEIGLDGVRMVGIWGVGGGGKTTLASSLYMEISCNFESHHILENIREKSSKYGLEKLQENILTTFSKTKVEVHSIVEGKQKIKSMLCSRKVLVILDDINDVDQLEALAGSHKWFGSGSRIIITTRDEHVLRTHKVDQVCPVKLLSHDESIHVFNRHALNEKYPIEDYQTLSLRAVSYAAGLPLALKVLGSFLYDKDKNEWISAMDKLKDIPDLKVMDKLKISYDGLEANEKELFLDIACFFRGEKKDDAKEILEACGFHPEIGIKVLRQKALITIVNSRFDMHDLIQEMGHYIIRGEHPNNPVKHSRVWKHKEIKDMCLWNETMENNKIESIKFDQYYHDHYHSSQFCEIVSHMKKLRCLRVWMRDDKYEGGPNFLSNELQYFYWYGYRACSFPDSFKPIKLVSLKLGVSMQKELWNGCKHLPYLKVLQLVDMKELLSTPDFHGLPCLQKLTLDNCYKLEEIHRSLGNHTSLEYLSISRCYKLRMFPTISHMKNLKTLNLNWINGEIPFGIGELSNLQELDLSGNDFSQLDFKLLQLTRLKLLDLSTCVKLLKLPELPSSLNFLKADQCYRLKAKGDFYKNCEWLCQVSLMLGSVINDGDRLLQTMLEGKAIENHSILLLLEGFEIAKWFRPPLAKGSRYRFQLPDNWYNDYSGFLICAVFFTNYWNSSADISINNVSSGMDFEDHVGWEESDGDDDKYTWVGYVSFGSLRHTTWWDHTYKALCFDIEDFKCSGFGVRLIDKKSKSGLTETLTYSCDYAPNYKIQYDSASTIRISIN